MNIKEILDILPHRYPFLLIDRVTKMEPAPEGNWTGRKIEAIKNVTMNEPFFMGHFPGNPVMPGVLIIEAMAQACAIVGYRPPESGGKMGVYFASIDNAKFRRPVVPGDRLTIKSEIKKDRGSMFLFRCEAFVDEQLVAEADLLAKSFYREESQ